MNVIEFALEIEREGESFYRTLAGETTDKGIRTILNRLADDEVKHARTLEAIRDNTEPAMADTVIMNQASGIFKDMNRDKVKISTGIEQVALYKKAQDLEKKSQDFYSSKAEEADDEGVRNLFLRIADEEKKHFLLLHYIIEMVSRPLHWVENAEFFHLEDY
jgi:rubrerythrin